jgi:hypothetical protein
LADVKIALAASNQGRIVVADESPQGEVLFAEVADQLRREHCRLFAVFCDVLLAEGGDRIEQL